MNNSNQQTAKFAYESGLTRRAFLKQSAVASVVAGLILTKPSIAKSLLPEADSSAANETAFSLQQKAILVATQMQIFPADGDGPSAEELNALPYLEWALTDPDNIEDGDREFILRGVNALEDLAIKNQQGSFNKIPNEKQHQLIQLFSKTELGENWMSILIYYLLEALLLDPVYGGNPNGIGWLWLEHQPGFPRPDSEHIYRSYQV